MLDEAYRAWLNTLPITDKTIGNQLSRIHRLEKAFGDIDAAFDADGMASVLLRLEYSAGDAAAKKPLPNGIVSKGKPVGTMSTLRHAANKYRTFRLQHGASVSAPALPTQFVPIAKPKAAPGRGLKPTGFWIFQANPKRWKADDWLASGETSLLYFVSKDDRDLIQVGDLGVVRRTARRGKPAAILALVEVVEATSFRPEPDPKFFVDSALGAEPDYRVRLERLAIFDEPVIAPSLPGEPAFDLLQKGLQRTTTPFPGEAFAHLAGHAGFVPLDLATARASRSPQVLKDLQAAAKSAPPEMREVVSRRIERGPIGDKVKAARGHRCQVCEALGRDPIAFYKSGGEPYAEAHHVILVSTMIAGVLDATNVMVLCPNHHRQAHYGAFEIVSADEAAWTIRVDGHELIIPQTAIW
ncbi:MULTISPECIES: EVE domain-containing protein [unclassified Sphingopyxis]|uniref:EVE domain-containing protein n=1 Tax=unclassified Sphingopyxis TaxID=2614943 RepID=UPI0024AE1161|nr:MULTISPECIES: EVE domain-containing protein [unclassified Sphingopyxis]